MKVFLVVSAFVLLVGCSNSVEVAPDREYQKQAAEKADRQLDKEVKRLP